MRRPHYKDLYLTAKAELESMRIAEARLISDNEGVAARISAYETCVKVADKQVREIADILWGLMAKCYELAPDNTALLNICHSIDDALTWGEDIDWSGG